MTEVTLIVPAETSDLFRSQAIWGVELAAGAVTEAAGWLMTKKVPQAESDLPNATDRLAALAGLVGATPEDAADDLEVTAERGAVLGTIHGCLSVAVDELEDMAESWPPKFE